jgi:CRP-like cAMP-binding protein
MATKIQGDKMEPKWVTILSSMPLFREINPEGLQGILNCLKPKISKFVKNEYIFMAGDHFEGIGIMLSGSAVVIKENAAGNRVIMAVLEPGDMFGEMVAFADHDRWPASVYTQESSTVTFLPPGKVIGSCEQACAMHKRLIMNLLKIISDKALALNRKVEYLSIKSMRGKISTFLLEEYRKTGKTTFVLPLKRNEMADFLNVSRPSMSREMGRMQEEGIIEFHRASVRLKDLEALRGMVE